MALGIIKHLFKKVNAKTGEALNNPEQYGYMLMNPTTIFKTYLPTYLETLKNLPEEERNRFLLGFFGLKAFQVVFTPKEMAQAERNRNVPLRSFCLDFLGYGMDDLLFGFLR